LHPEIRHVKKPLSKTKHRENSLPIERENIHCQGARFNRSYDMRLISAEGQKLASFKAQTIIYFQVKLFKNL
jgi:hypothetical protein